MKKRIRFFCLTLLAMVAGMANAQNVAKVGDKEYATLQAAFDAATDGQTVTLLRNYNAANEDMACGTRQFVINKSITFDGNGYTLTTKQRGIGIGNVTTNTNTTYAINENIDVIIKKITVKNLTGARCIDTRGCVNSLTLENATLSTVGTTHVDNNGDYYLQPLTIGGDQSNTATINISNSTIETSEDGSIYYAIITFNPVNMTISNSTIKGWADIYAREANSSAGSAGSTFTIKDGSKLYSKNTNSGNTNAFSAIKINDKNVTVNIQDAEINVSATGNQKQGIVSYEANTSSSSVSISEGCSVNLTGDNAVIAFNDANDGYEGGRGCISITGGTFNSDPSNYLAEGYKVVENNGTWTVHEKTYAAQIGEGEDAVKYETLEEAAEAAKSGETIVLLDDIDLSNHARSASDDIILTGVTLDLNGKTIRGFNSGVRYSGTGAVIKNGTFDFVDAEAKPNYGLSIGSYNSKNHDTGFTLQDLTVKGGINIDYADVTLNNVDINMGASTYYAIWVDEDGASATYNSGAITASTSATAVFGVAKGLNGAADGSIKVTGGKILTNGKNLRLGGNYLPVEVSDGVFDAAVPEDCCAEGYIPTANTDEETKATYPYTVKQGAFVARIGDKKYETLAAAIEAATDGANTITLLANIDLGKNAANINKAVTIEGDGYTISSTATQAIAISGSGNVTINNTVVSAKNRGINVLDVSTGFTLNVNNSTIQSQVNDPTTTYTIGEDSRGINVANADGVTVNITNSTIQGFSYDINIPRTGKNLTVNVTGGKTYGRAIVNNWGSNNTFNLNGVEVHGLNNQTGPTEAFSCIVDNAGCQNNNYIIQDCQFIATLSEAAMTTSGSSASEQMIDLRGTNSVVTVKGNTTYTINEGAETRGGIVTTEVYLMSDKGNIVRFDDTAKQNFVSWAEKLDAFDFADKDDENYWPLTFVAQVQLVYPSGDKYYGKYLRTIKSAFEDEKYGDKTQITLLKDITLDENLTCPLTDGQYFIMNMSDYAVTKGDYSIALVPGTTVYSTKKTDIFSSANADFKVVETEEDGGFAYTVVAKVYVAQVGEGENAVQYESLEEALAAISTVTTVNHPKSGMTINQYKANGTVTLLADCEGNGIVIDSGSDLTIDFAGHTYSVTGNLVGSDNTESQGFQLLKNSNVTFKSTAEEPGSITSAKAIFLVQNYSNLTLENMTLDGSNLSGSGAYTLSNNNGNIVINNSTITAKEGEDNFAFDVCRNSSYPSVNVTVKGESVINGNIEVSASGSDAKDGFSLMLEGGTLNGKIVLDGSAKTAMANTPDKAKVSKSNSLESIAAPAGYMWKDNGDETSTLAKLLARVTHCSGMDYDTNEEMWSSTNCSTAAEVEQNVSLNICDDFASDEWYADRVWVYGELNANLTLGNNQYVYIAELGADANFTGTISAAEGYILVETDVKEDFDDVYGREHKSAKLYTVRRDPNYAKIKIVKTDGTEYGYDALLSSSEDMNIGDGDQMILLDDVDYGYNVPWYPGFDLTIDLNGHTLTNTKGGVLGLSKNKTLTIIDSSDSKTGKVALENIANSPVINASSNNNAKLVIESGSVIAPSNSNKGAIVAGSDNEVSITGGCFAGKLSITEGSTATIQISGGVFSQEPAEEYCAEGYIVANNTDPETMEAYPYAVRQAHYIAAIGDTKYETLADAVKAAGTAETTITLLTDAATDGVISGDGVVVPSGSNITFDLNGLTYNVYGETVGSPRTETNGFQLLKNSNITFKNGTLKATSPTAQMLIQNYSNLTLEDVNLDGTTLSGDAYALSNNCGTINLTGSTSITAKSGGRAFDTCKYGSYAIPTVNINTTGVISGPIEATGGKLNIENGKFDVTWVTDSHYTTGDIQITGGVFTAEVAEEYCAEGFVCTDNDDPTYKFTVKTKEDAGIFELWDNKADYVRDTTVKASKISYFRSFSDKVTNHRQCWFVPFDYTVTDNDKEIFKFYKIHMVAAADEGVTEVTDNTQVYVYIEEMTGEDIVLKANRPYVIKPNKVLTDYEFIAENVDLEGRNTGSRLNVTTAEFNYDFYGTYSTFKEDNQVAHSWIGVNTSGNLFWNKVGSSINRYRWYIKITKNNTNEGYAKPNLMFIEDEDESESIVTGISANNIDGEIEGFYTVGGVKLDHPRKGLNIIRFTNGTTKKIFIK